MNSFWPPHWVARRKLFRRRAFLFFWRAWAPLAKNTLLNLASHEINANAISSNQRSPKLFGAERPPVGIADLFGHKEMWNFEKGL